MDQIWLFALIFSTIFPFFIFFFLQKYNKLINTKNSHKILPPSPPSLPIIGHLHLLKNPIIHRTLQHLSLQYGSIFSLNLGSFRVVVISSPDAIEECFTKNDIVLANRPQVLAGKHIHYEWTTLGSASYGPLWLNLRRLTTLELLSRSRVSSFEGIRVEEVRSLVKGLYSSSKENFVRVEIGSKLSGLSLNILTRILTGKKYLFFGDDENDVGSSNEAENFLGVMREVFELSGLSNVADTLPFLRFFGFRNVEGRMVAVRRKMDSFLDGLIEECRRTKNDQGETKAMIFKLLDLQESDPTTYSDQIIKGFIMVMLIAGTDTSAVTMEWALSLLLNHPNVLKKAREEIENCKGDGGLVEEFDIPKLPYIQCIINETFRLFPAAPLLVGHLASEDLTISGYHIDKGKTIMINAWAVHRDPNLWKNPLEFRPERFEGLKSEDYRYTWVPFGLGRRSCSGAYLANQVIGLTLATLVQCFDWDRVDEDKVDLTEGVGLTMPKAKPLEAMCRARTNMIDLLSNM
ncbi:isoflavone 2'-hydroxylase-like [Chenopodium quinoa]|uniref:isoflavone 2'-hydroxylase-like n=1 Tax=Chenopodium quinoa TaxID=63459 RepID=UPI000B792C60|nr:isoflavone 2'-hydroxylase-like [Chenopodium quinoa]